MGAFHRYLLLAAAAISLSAAAPADTVDDPARRIVDAALESNNAYAKLTYLSDRIGHRLSGSAGLERAVAWSVEEFRRDGLEKVWTEKVMVPHWVRGSASAGIVAPIDYPLALLALGGSVATPPGGLTAKILVVDSFEQLEARSAEVEGKLVLYNKPMETASDYGSAAQLRVHGASKAAELGAVGMLIRSLGTADYRLPHTGTMRYDETAPKIPGAAIAVEDAALISRLIEAGDEVEVRLELGCKTLPDAESANVIAELPGRERPDEIVLIGAHLDSWDVGQGAHDDGAGCVVVMETLALLKRLGLVPRRTIRAVLFTNEENGLAGGKAYAAAHDAALHVAAIESDSGGAAPTGFGVSAGPGGFEVVQQIARALQSIGADTITDRGGGADISPLKKLGVPALGLRQDVTHYFDFHHSEADTLDKVQPEALDRNLAALAVMAYMLAELDEPLPRFVPEPEETK